MNKKTSLFFIIAIIISFGLGILISTNLSDDSSKTHRAKKNSKTEKTWTCSMHPQIQLPKAGTCPICAMDLIPVEKEPKHAHKHKEIWTCSMHPQIKLPKKGLCPTCNMDLIPLEKDDSHDHHQSDKPTISLSPYAQKLARVQTSKVLYDSPSNKDELVGQLEWDETKLISQASMFNGRIEKLYVTYTGQYVKKGSPIAEIYSPELFTATGEWREAKKNNDTTLIKSVERRLGFLGLSQNQMDYFFNEVTDEENIIHRATASGVVMNLHVFEGEVIKEGQELMRLGSISKLWVELDVYENDLPGIKLKQKVKLKTESLPDKTFEGKVEFIHPQLNVNSRTVKVRLSVRNKDKMLKPGMLVRAKLENSNAGKMLLIPATAPLITGKRAVVYVEIDEGKYEGRQITLGREFDSQFEVLSGLNEGESVVTRGAFKIDASMQIQAKPSMMYSKEDLD